MANGGIIGPVNEPVLSDKISAFTAPGSFTKSSLNAPATATVLVLAGGGGGGGKGASSGGGAGGFRLLSSHPLPASAVTVTVGGGGAGGPPSAPVPSGCGTKGGNSTFATATSPITATGGAEGRAPDGVGPISPANRAGLPGGSGSGGACVVNTGGTNAGGAGNEGSFSPSEGNSGGTGAGHSAGGSGGAGGAGASNGFGCNGPSLGGPGTDVTPTFGASPQPFYAPTNGLYAGGGSGHFINMPGSSRTARAPGGGGQGGNYVGDPVIVAATDAIVNTGAGGGGNGIGCGGTAAGAGAGGVILVKEANSKVTAPGVWTIQDAFTYAKAGTWGG
jgi:hypothetical protein